MLRWINTSLVAKAALIHRLQRQRVISIVVYVIFWCGFCIWFSLNGIFCLLQRIIIWKPQNYPIKYGNLRNFQNIWIVEDFLLLFSNKKYTIWKFRKHWIFGTSTANHIANCLNSWFDYFAKFMNIFLWKIQLSTNETFFLSVYKYLAIDFTLWI